MSHRGRDRSLDALLELDGQVLVVDPAGKHWVKFSVKQINPSSEKPHGLNYSLTLHDEAGRRLVGFDNAHAVWSGSGPGKCSQVIFVNQKDSMKFKPYDYANAVELLADFWDEVDAVLKEKGIIG